MNLQRVAGVVAGVAVMACCAGKPAKGAEGFDSFISPVTSFTNFEDPLATTEVRPIFMFHSLSDELKLGNTRVGNGGEAYLFAVQLRYAITERLGLIATKDGYVWLRPDEEIPGALTHDDGWANLAFGLKYSLLHDVQNQRVVTFGLRYEAPSGDAQVLQGKVYRASAFNNDRGKGVMNPFLSAGMTVENFHILGYTGVRAALDDVDSSFFDLSLHVDHPFGNFYPLIEMNWVQTIADGDRLPLNGEGFDLLNLGSVDSDGKGVVTGAVGARYRITTCNSAGVGIDLGAAVEFPLTDREDIFNLRVTTDVIVRLL